MQPIKNLGVMLDCSRNAVMKVYEVKKFIDYISKMGYTVLQLYTEDTYEVENNPYFGYMRGRYSISEIKEIDAYCKTKKIELVPCIQTLAHIKSIFRWKDYLTINDNTDILFIGDEKTYKFIDDIFATLSKTFTSRNVNIGMDEAFLIGRGKYIDKFGYDTKFNVLLKHLNKVIEIAKKYGFTPMMWSDMFFRAMNNGGYYTESKIKVDESIKIVYLKILNLFTGITMLTIKSITIQCLQTTNHFQTISLLLVVLGLSQGLLHTTIFLLEIVNVLLKVA